MPIAPTPLGRTVIETARLAVAENGYEAPDPESCCRLARTALALVADSEVANTTLPDPETVVERWQELGRVGEWQSLKLCNAADSYLRRRGVPVADIASALLTSTTMGRRFGRLSGEGATGSSLLLVEMMKFPSAWFSYDPDAKQVDFNESAVDLFRGLYDSGRGCAALSFTVTVQDQTRLLYDVFWDTCAKQYVDEYVLGAGNCRRFEDEPLFD